MFFCSEVQEQSDRNAALVVCLATFFRHVGLSSQKSSALEKTGSFMMKEKRFKRDKSYKKVRILLYSQVIYLTCIIMYMYMYVVLLYLFPGNSEEQSHVLTATVLHRDTVRSVPWTAVGRRTAGLPVHG